MAEHRWRSRYVNSVSCTPTPQNGEDRSVLASVENYRPSNDTKGFHRSWEPSSRREIGALNENNVDRLTASEGRHQLCGDNRIEKRVMHLGLGCHTPN